MNRGTGYNNPTVVELENQVLRNRLAGLKSAAAAMVESVEHYVRQECLRAELLNTKDNLKRLLK